MAEHVRNSLVRDGLVFQPALVLTFSKFVDSLATSVAAPSALSLHLLVEDLLSRLPLPAFDPVKSLRGFHEAVAGWLEEFSAAGATAERLTPLSFPPSLLSILGEVERALAARGQGLRHLRLAAAAQSVQSSGLPGVEALYLDGFLSFTTPEIGVLHALAAHADVSLTLPDWPGAGRARRALLSLGAVEEAGPPAAATVRRTYVSSPTLEHEVEEICRRILFSGRPFREIGVIVRNPRRYLPALRSALERFRIPARFYTAEPLSAHPLVRYFSSLVDSALAGWDHAPLIAALAMNYSGIAGTPRGDRLDFQLREALPGRGLDPLRALAAGHPGLQKLVAALDALGRSLEGFATPPDWAARLSEMRGLLHIARPPVGGSHEEALLVRAQAAALHAFCEALDETAAALGPNSLLEFRTFWDKARLALSLTTLRVPDHRHNVVHVFDAWEARQWTLPLIFVCGLLEGDFPDYPKEDPLVPDTLRVRLVAAGLPVKTMADRRQEEEFLWTMASTRASDELVLTWPRFNDLGEETLPSFHLGINPQSAEPAEPVRPASSRCRAASSPAVISAEDLRSQIASRHPHWKPTAVESFLQCPFQFFSRYTLRLRPAPPKPEDRFDPLAQGTLVHSILAEWHRTGAPMLTLLDRLFNEYCRDKRVRQGYASEMARLQMARNLEAFLLDPRLQPGWEVHVEEPFEIELEPGVLVRGRIDRFEVSPDGSVRVCDYKYSHIAGLNKRFEQPDADRYVQGGLYLLALSGKYAVESFDYCALKGGARWKGWHSPIAVRDRMDEARRLTLDAVSSVASGVIDVRPWDSAACRYCDYRDACRVAELPAFRQAGEGE